MQVKTICNMEIVISFKFLINCYMKKKLLMSYVTLKAAMKSDKR